MDQPARAHQRADLNLSWVHDLLAVGGALPGHALPILVRQQIQHVVDMRDDGIDDEAELRTAGIQFLHLPTCDHSSTNLDCLRQGVAWILPRLARGERVLVHCEHGMGRSVLLALCVLTRLDVPPLDALVRVKQARPCMSPSPSQLETFVQWCELHGGQAPSWHALAGIAYSVRRTATGEFARV